jgi:hypothetical protein
METLQLATRNYVCIENGGCHIFVVNRIGNGKGMHGHQNFTPKSADFTTLPKYATRIFPKREQFYQKA